jgi:hypothetical protein
METVFQTNTTTLHETRLFSLLRYQYTHGDTCTNRCSNHLRDTYANPDSDPNINSHRYAHCHPHSPAYERHHRK